MKEPCAGVISYDAERDGASTRDGYGITAHRVYLPFDERGVQRWIVRGIICCFVDDLHRVSVHVATI